MLFKNLMNSDTHTCKQFKNHLKLEEKTIRSRLPIAITYKSFLIYRNKCTSIQHKKKESKKKKRR